MWSRRKNIFQIFWLAILAGSAWIIPGRVLAYDTNVAHPNIAELAAQIYNERFPNQQLSLADMENIKLGARLEDVPTRWYQHFYDPIHGRGIWFNDNKQTALSWATDPFAQVNFSLGDNSWQRAISDWQKGDRALAMQELGHTIHLISDMAVPAHTRDDIHPAGDSYEQYVKNNWSSAVAGLRYDFRSLNSLNTAFYALAKYSNGNFYSDDTIEHWNYKIINISGHDRKYFNKRNYLFAKTADGHYLYGFENLIWTASIKDVRYDEILNSYASRLIPQAVGYSAGMIDLFFREATKKQTEKLPWLRSNLSGVVDTAGGAALTAAEGAKDWLVGSNVWGEGVQQIGEDALRQVDITMTEKAQIARGEIPPATPPISDSPIAATDSVSTPTPSNRPAVTTTTIVATPITSTPIYTGGGSAYGGGNVPVPESEPTSTIPTSTPPTDPPTSTPITTSTPSPTSTPEVPTPTSTPTSTPETPTTTPETPTSTPGTPTTTPDDTPPAMPTIILATPDASRPIVQISVTSTDASSSPVAFDIVYTTALSPLDTDWKPFIVSSTATVHNFTARRGLIYQFRARAIDQVGNVSDFSKIASTTFDQISLNGTQSESERVLTAENSPYLINGNQCYIIPAGTKLTIEAGVEIKIGKYLCIMVNGILDAQGDSDAHITFSQLNPGEYWAQIFLNSATATFNYADITGGDTGGLFVWKRGLVFADNNSYLELNNSTVDDLYEMAGAAVGAKDSVVKIRDSVLADTGISSNCGNNVCNHGIRAGGGTLYLDNVLLRNVVYGIRAGLPGYQSYPVVYSNNFSSIMGENIGVLFMPDNEYFIRTSTPV